MFTDPSGDKFTLWHLLIASTFGLASWGPVMQQASGQASVPQAMAEYFITLASFSAGASVAQAYSWSGVGDKIIASAASAGAVNGSLNAMVIGGNILTETIKGATTESVNAMFFAGIGYGISQISIPHWIGGPELSGCKVGDLFDKGTLEGDYLYGLSILQKTYDIKPKLPLNLSKNYDSKDAFRQIVDLYRYMHDLDVAHRTQHLKLREMIVKGSKIGAARTFQLMHSERSEEMKNTLYLGKTKVVITFLWNENKDYRGIDTYRAQSGSEYKYREIYMKDGSGYVGQNTTLTNIQIWGNKELFFNVLDYINGKTDILDLSNL